MTNSDAYRKTSNSLAVNYYSTLFPVRDIHQIFSGLRKLLYRLLMLIIESKNQSYSYNKTKIVNEYSS